MKNLYQLKTELLDLLSEELPVKKFRIAVQLINAIVSWKETEIEIEEEEKGKICHCHCHYGCSAPTYEGKIICKCLQVQCEHCTT